MASTKRFRGGEDYDDISASDAAREGFKVVVGDLMSRLSEYQTFYDSIVMLPATLDASKADYIRKTLGQILLFLNQQFPVKQPNLGVYQLESIARKAWIESLSEEQLDELGRDLPLSHRYDTLKRNVIELCFKIFRNMFRIQDMFSCVNIVDPEWPNVFFEWRLILVLIEQNYRSWIPPQVVNDGAPHVLNRIYDLYTFLTFFVRTLNESVNSEFLDHDRNSIFMRLDEFAAIYPGLTNQLRLFSTRCLDARNFITLADLRYLFLNIMGPYFATYVPGIQDHDLITAYQRISMESFKFGRFIEFGNYAFQFGQLARLNEHAFREYLPYIR